MKKISIMLLFFALMVTLCACGAAQKAEQASEAEPNELTAEAATESASEPVAEPAVETFHPYAWLGYDELPACEYFDGISSQVFYREYDEYALGYKRHSIEATDGVNVYSFDDMSGNLSLILEGKAYAFNKNSMIYVYNDMTATYQNTLEQKAQQMEQGIDKTGKEYKGMGSEPIPLYCDEGDTGSYEYYEFFTDGQYPMTERVYFKDGNVFAIYTHVATGADTTLETTQVITAFSATPDPALFALPENFDEYTLYK